MRAMEHLQLDPLQVIARAQDLALHSRVIDYNQDDWTRPDDPTSRTAELWAPIAWVRPGRIAVRPRTRASGLS